MADKKKDRTAGDSEKAPCGGVRISFSPLRNEYVGKLTMRKRIGKRLPDDVKKSLLLIRDKTRKVSSYLISIPDMRGEYNSMDPEIVKDYNRERHFGPKKLLCYVPFNNLGFSMEGRALACNYNQKVELGRYPNQTVRQIWFGEPGKILRKHMEHNDLSYGCQHCEFFFKNRLYTVLKTRAFDKYSSYGRRQLPRVMEFEIMNTCNLECIMCNGKASSSIRKNREGLPPIENPYDGAFVDQIEEFLPKLKEAKFYGGEPFLIDIYYKIWERIIDVNPNIEIFVITNGTVLNKRIKQILEKGRFTLGVSFDALTKETYERIRVGANYETVMKNLLYFNDYCRKRDTVMSVSTTLMRENWEEVPKIVAFCNEIGAANYFSYLKKPYALALWNLEARKLEEIEKRLLSFEFPEDTIKTKYNKQCYQDFIHQIRNWKQINRKREKEGQPA